MPRRAEAHLVRIRGRRNWYISYRGKVYSTHCRHEEKSEAEQCLADFIDELDRPPDNPTIADILDLRFRHCEGRVMRIDNIKWQHAPLKKHLGHLYPDQLTPATMRGYARKRGDTRTALRRELEELRMALRYAHKRKVISEVPDIDLPPRLPPRDVFATKAQVAKLLAACESYHIRLFIQIAATTGARKGAILDLTWDRVNLESKVVDFNDPDRPMTKKRRAVTAIPQPLVAALQDARALARTDRVLEYRGKPVDDIENGFRKTATRAGLPWLTPHVLKHSVVSGLADRGWSVDDIADMTQTTPPVVRRIYRKVNPERLREMAEIAAEGLFSVTPLNPDDANIRQKT